MKLKYLLYLLLLIGTVGCYQPDDGEFTEPITLYEKVSGRWALTGIMMTDEVAVTSNISPSKQNLGTYFNYADFVLDLNVDANSKPGSYIVHGEVPPLFPAAGFWALSSDFQPTNSGSISVILYQDAQRSHKTDELKLVSVPGNNREMELQLTRISGGTPFISYNFKLKALD